MGNMCCRRVGYSPNGADMEHNRCSQHQQQQHQQQQQIKTQATMSNAYHNAGDDCAINELLEGRMDLDVILPDGRQVRLTVERRTPMMDLLVQAASATKISPGSHTIHVFGDGGKGNNTLHYKPSTPIGSLDTNTICIVPKKDIQESAFKRVQRIANRPFEPTFRVQVHLPRNQLTVVRVSPRVKISELRNMVCQEKGLESCRYQLVRPSDPVQALNGDMTLSEYGSTEISLLSNSSIESNICNSTSHIMPYSKRVEDQKKKTGILRLLAEDANKKVEKTKVTMNGHHRFVPTLKVDDNHVSQGRYKPKKRRPAPPPPPVLPEAPFHSRQSSSDSSGYHEATSSYLHEEHCISTDEKASSDSSGVSSLDAKVTTVEPPLPPNTRKRKAPPPPPQTYLAGDGQASRNLETAPVQSEISQQTQPQIALPDETRNIVTKNPIAQDSIKEEDKQAECIPTKLSLEVNIIDTTASKKGKTEECKTKEISTPNETIKIKEKQAESISLSTKFSSNVNKSDYTPSNKKETEECQVKEIYIANTVKIKEKPFECVQKEPKPTKTENKSNIITIKKKENEYKTESNSIEDALKIKEKPFESLPKEPPKTENKPNVIIIKKKENEYKTEKNSFEGEPVTRVALVAFNAKIEQDVTQQEIASSIQAAFHSLENPQRVEPSLLAIKQRVPRIENDKPFIPDDNSSVDADEIVIPPQTVIEDETTSKPYPLQKSSAILTLNLEAKDEEDIGLETFVPPPTEFRSDVKEDSSIDDTHSSSPEPIVPENLKTLKRSSSLVSVTDSSSNYPVYKVKHRNLQRSLSDISADDQEEFEAEQERLQQEYVKLQKQFILWQQQLLSNHAMLSEECIVPQFARTLRQSHSLPEGEDYTDETPSSVPLVSRSLSYEPTKNSKCSTLPRSTINIPSLELNSVPVSNGSRTLRSSKNKSYFKPPQVRVSTKSRQRLPPEVKKDSELDISDDNKMLSTILPTFESLKFISEHNEEEMILKKSHLQNGTPNIKRENNYNRKVQEEIKIGKQNQNPNKLATFPKPHLKVNNGSIVQNGFSDVNLKCVNRDNTQSNRIVTSAKLTEQSWGSQPPPPPPLPTVTEKPKEIVTNHSSKSSGVQNKMLRKEIQQQQDPREQLMNEIRKFGGRHALRKISCAD